MLTSPAVRAVTTATIIARELRVDAARIAQDERLYLASAPAMLAVVRELGGDALHLMVFGHNPGITDFANRLSAGEQIDNLPTCGVFTATFDVDDWDALELGSRRGCRVRLPAKRDVNSGRVASAPAAPEHRDRRSGHRRPRHPTPGTAMTSAMSRGATQREKSASGMSARLRGVSIVPGRIALTVMSAVAQFGREALGQALHAGL